MIVIAGSAIVSGTIWHVWWHNAMRYWIVNIPYNTKCHPQNKWIICGHAVWWLVPLWVQQRYRYDMLFLCIWCLNACTFTCKFWLNQEYCLVLKMQRCYHLRMPSNSASELCTPKLHINIFYLHLWHRLVSHRAWDHAPHKMQIFMTSHSLWCVGIRLIPLIL